MLRNLTIRRRVGIASAVISVFLILLFILIFTYSFPDTTPQFLRIFLTYHFEFMLLMVALSVFFGAALVYLMSEDVRIQEKESKLTAQFALSLLNPDERKAVGLLIARGGECLQAEVARQEGMTRLKAHRVAKSLSARGIISLKKNGKTAVLSLEPAVRQALMPA